MQRIATTARSFDLSTASADQGARSGLPVDVPSEQLWRDAIQATRRAATAAAELRLALQASREAGTEDRAI